MRYMYVVVAAGLLLGLFGCRACTEQHDPRGDWKKFKDESNHANQPTQQLTDDGKLPSPATGEKVALSPIDEKYANFCAGCHGANGAGDGPAGAGLNPKPRNFVTWDTASVTDDYIAKVIREGGAAVGKSPMMAPWGGVLQENDIAEMVKKVKAFKK